MTLRFTGADPGFGEGGLQLPRPIVAEVLEYIFPHSRDYFSLIFNIYFDTKS